MPAKKSAPKKSVKKAGAKKVAAKKVSNEIFSTKVNFGILVLFCIFIAFLFTTLY